MRKMRRTIRALAVKAAGMAGVAGDLIGKAAKSAPAFAAGSLVRSNTRKAKTKRSSKRRAMRGAWSKVPKRRRRSRTRRTR
jgi:hypothetical protein